MRYIPQFRLLHRRLRNPHHHNIAATSVILVLGTLGVIAHAPGAGRNSFFAASTIAILYYGSSVRDFGILRISKGCSRRGDLWIFDLAITVLGS
jgi:hypothetical protein